MSDRKEFKDRFQCAGCGRKADGDYGEEVWAWFVLCRMVNDKPTEIFACSEKCAIRIDDRMKGVEWIE